jgi:hypothetical protein
MAPRTLFLSRLLGLYCVVASLAMITHKRAVVETVTALVRDAPVMLVLGSMTLVAGLAMVLGHNVWSGGALPVVVTVMGWAALAKSLLFLFVPPAGAAGFFLGTLQYEQYFYCYAGISLILGLFLTFQGFRSTPR